jgi:subtilisin family serine protease
MTTSNLGYVIEDAEATIDDAQFNAPASIDRIDQRSLPLDSTYIFNSTGSGVHVYVIDSGIRTTHQDFNGRALASYDAVGGGSVPYAGDCTGHGSKVASIIGGTTYGVAKNALLHSVRVFGCSTTTSNSAIIAGVDWVTTNRQLPAVANMSLGTTAYAPLDQAVINSINSGITYVAAAGNDNSPANNYSPARVSQVITVGATDFTDNRASFSNYGSVLDLFAPGVNILGASHTSDIAFGVDSGTSFSSPLVAGIAALYLERAPSATPFTVSSTITNTATHHVVGNPAGSPNRLAYSGFIPPPTGSGRIPFYRFRFPSGSLRHFYTTDFNEGALSGLIYDGEQARVYSQPAPQYPDLVPLYRFRHSSGEARHFYTTDYNEGVNAGFTYEQIAGYVLPYELIGTTMPLYRFRVPGVLRHFYTVNYDEGANEGFIYEQIAGYVFPL